MGWLGYPDDKVRALTQQAYADGWRAMKMKVGGPIDDDLRRARIIREEIGPDALLMMDANQVWDVDEAITNMAALAEVDPYWIEEPTHADDVLGHARIARAVTAPIRVATGEVAANRVIFKQLLQADAIGVMQVDACRVAGVNEVLSELLMAAKFGVPVCPHAGGVGLCEYVQHLAIFDYLRVGTRLDGRMIEYVDHLHEHFVDPVRTRGGRYLLPTAPGYSVTHETGVDRRVPLPGRPGMAVTADTSARPGTAPAARRGPPADPAGHRGDRHRAPGARRVPPGPPGGLHRGGDRRRRRRLGHRRGRPRSTAVVEALAAQDDLFSVSHSRRPAAATRVVGALSGSGTRPADPAPWWRCSPTRRSAS